MDHSNLSFSESWSVGNDVPERDYTPEFTTDQIFEGRDAMLDWVRKTGYVNGFVIVIDKSSGKKGSKMPRCTLICERGGLYQPPRQGRTSQRNTGTKKCSCPFKLRGAAHIPDGVMWSLTVLNGSHNHEAAANFEGHGYPSRLTATQKQVVREMSNSTAPREILSLLKQQDPSNTTGIKSIYNVLAMHKKEQLGDLSEVGYVLRELNNKNYTYDFLTNEHTSEITDILWVHPTSLELYVSFPSVLIMDSTYKINEYGIPLFEVVGITSTMKTYSLMFAYLSNETKERMTWALDTLKRWMVRRGAEMPSVVVSDRDLALLGAIEACFPFAHHILCIWHINQCVMKKCRPMLGTRWEQFNASWHSVIHASTPDGLNSRWTDMCNDFSLYVDAMKYLWDTWLCPYKERFVDGYVNNWMHIGSHSTQRVESAHARLKRYFGDTSASLSTSFQKIEKMLTTQFGDIQQSFQQSLNIPRHQHLCEPIYSEIRCRISLHAMNLIEKQLERANRLHLYKGDSCHCKIKSTHGLPCAHLIALYRDAGMPIPLSAIHIHWSTLSMPTPKRTDDGGRPDKAAQLIERLNEMDPSSRESMIERFCDMADPSRCTVRPPAYNTEQKGRPTKRDEQNIGRRPSFSLSTSEYGAPPILKTPRRNMRGHLVLEFPQPYQRYISHCVDVRGDGHCGFRAIAAALHGSEDEWVQVRLNLIQEVQHNFDMYDSLYFHQGWASTLLDRLNCFEQPAPMLNWMDAVQMGVIIASAYNIVLHTFDIDPAACYTHLPLKSVSVPVAQRRHIAIGRVHNSHFVQLILSPHYPVPPVVIWKLSGIDSDGWANPYESRIQLWYEVMGIPPPGLHFGGNVE